MSADSLEGAAVGSMQITVLILVGIGFAVAIARYGTPLWVARVLSASPTSRLGLHARGEDAVWVNHSCRLIARGIFTRLMHPSRRWIDDCEATAPAQRALVVEGATMTEAALRIDGRSRLHQTPETAGRWVWPAHFGLGVWSALRFGRNFEEVLRLAQSVDAWHRYLVLDGYGFKFGLLDFMHRTTSVAHFRAIPGYYRRAAFHGLGRAMYAGFLSDRPALFEAIGEFAPDHDGDLVEGVAFQAAYLHMDDPRRAIRLVRAMPYEWRNHAHLGLVLGFHAQRTLDAGQFESAMSRLPKSCAEAIRLGLARCDETQKRARDHHPVSGYGLWRELLSAQLEREQVLEPMYTAFSEEGRAENKGLVS